MRKQTITAVENIGTETHTMNLNFIIHGDDIELIDAVKKKRLHIISILDMDFQNMNVTVFLLIGEMCHQYQIDFFVSLISKKKMIMQRVLQ